MSTDHTNIAADILLSDAINNWLRSEYGLDDDDCLSSGDVAECVDMAVKHFLTTRTNELEKAFGGCKKCYGKGYSTVRYGYKISADFEGQKDHIIPDKTNINYCSCDRGKQLEQVVNLQRNELLGAMKMEKKQLHSVGGGDIGGYIDVPDDAYNRRVEIYNQAVDEFNEKLATLQEQYEK